ncbi:MAG TPA: GNAT family N-acetyltransferase [Fimbriimonadaceae bacterium]|mgnify:CR=1 FL=1|nr:GNAT family N-acetyltransferase [Fimbriimonadaceae bacterium]
MEIRTVREGETEAFLELLCDVFHLDIARARSVFYSEPFYDPGRKWALFEGSRLVSILTTVPLEFGWGNAVGIAGVATCEDRQGRGYAIRLIEHVLEQGKKNGEEAAYLFARDPRVYLKVGFEILDEAILAPIEGVSSFVMPRTLSFDETRSVYEAWSNGDPSRLCRDERRWNYWKWNLRICTAHEAGYLCLEGDRVRECVPGGGEAPWPVPDRTQWFGLRTMAQQTGAPIGPVNVEQFLLGWKSPVMPQFFMTDQF